MPGRRNCNTRFARWPNGDILVAGNVASEADFREILDFAGDPGMARTANIKHPMLFEVQSANIPGGSLSHSLKAHGYRTSSCCRHERSKHQA